MCGIFGVMCGLGGEPTPDRAAVERLRDVMTHRGPDGAGYWESPERHVRLGHRRLAVIDPTEAGAQPIVGEDGSALVYNGELYNDAELRQELEGLGHRFKTACDTETVLAALRRWGPGATARLRGMYAFAWYDASARRLLMARDPLGIKPLYWWTDGQEMAFSSEISALLGHPLIRAEPDLFAISAYLTTIRTTIGERTLFRDIRCLTPGERILVESGTGLAFERLPTTRVRDWNGPSMDVGTAVRESTARHLRSDVPMCALLSGGLDSTIIASAARERGELRTYAAGAATDSGDGDLEWAERAGADMGTMHSGVTISRETFRDRWEALVGAALVPLSTPNEVAIHQVARVLRAEGHVVALSGEGADELFGGYSIPMASSSAYVDGGGIDGGLFQLNDSAWIPVEAKGAVLREHLATALEGDADLIGAYRAEFAHVREERDDEPLQAHLRFMRRVNLAGLLLRLDSATMRAGVEGRTPFADIAVAACAEASPMDSKYRVRGGRPETKVALREAFGGCVPAGIIARPKASFPLPFQDWIGDLAGVLRESGLARELFSEAAIATVAQRPGELWRLAWPMINIALWGRAVGW